MRKFKMVLAFALAAAMVVTAAPVSTQAAAMKLNKTTATIYINGSKTYKTVDLDVKNASTKTYSVAFTSSNTKIATVNKTSGVVTPKQNGKITIYAKVTNKKTKNYKTLKCTVTVKTAPTAVKVANKDLPKTLEIGKTYDFGSPITPKDATNKRRWSITEGKGKITSVAGLFTTTEAGKVTVQVKDTYSGKSDTHTFEVVADAPAATQTGMRQITVKNGVAMDATKITVKRGSSDVSVAENGIVLSEDGKTAVITTAGNIIDTEYTVLCGDKTTTFKGAVSKVTSIEISSDKMAYDKVDLNTATSATVGYVVKNQFGDDITKSTSITATCSLGTATASNGTVTANVTGTKMLNTPVSLVLYNQDTGVTVTSNLTNSNKGLPSEVIVKGLYNADNKELTATNYNDTFYFLFQVKDQYGNTLTKTADLNDSGSFVKTFNGGLINIKSDDPVETINVAGTTYFAYKLTTDKTLTSGTATIMLIPGGSGKSVTESIQVGTGSTVTNFSLSAPTLVAEGDTDIEFTYTALDAQGNAVTNLEALKKVTITPSNGHFKWEKSGSTIKLLYSTEAGDGKAKAVANSGVSIVVQTPAPNYSSSTCNFTVKDEAWPSQVVGLKTKDDGKFATAAISDGAIKLVYTENFKVEDQYGRSYDMTSTKAADYGIQITADDATNKVFNDPAVNNDGNVSGSALLNATDAASSAAITATNNAGTESYTFKLVMKDGKKLEKGNPLRNITEASAYTQPFTATTLSKFTSYKVDDVAMLYSKSRDNGSKYAKEVSVYGIVSGGAEVKLTSGQYQLLGGTNTAVDTNGNLIANVDADTLKNAANNTVDGSYKVIVNLDGTEIPKTTKVSSKEPGISTLKLTDSGKSTIQIDATSGGAVDLKEAILSKIKGSDSYGFDIEYNTTSKDLNWISGSAIGGIITIQTPDFADATAKITNNATSAPEITGLVSGDTFVIKYNNFDKAFTVNVR